MLFEWLSNDEILVLEYKSLGQASDYRRLSRLDVNNGDMETLHEHSRFPGGETSGTEPIKGLIKTVEGHVGYALVKSRREQEVKFPESQYDKTAHSKALSEDHFLVWGDDGLYKLSTNSMDSIRLGPKFVSFDLIPPAYNENLQYVMDGGTIMRLADSSFIVIDTMFEVPDGFLYCSTYWSVFNPVRPEVIFDKLCYKRDSTGADIEVDEVGVADILSGQVTYLDALVGMDNCQAPVYAPDGRKIAFSANGDGYIIYREWNDGEIKK